MAETISPTAARPTMAVLVVVTMAAHLAMNIILPSLPGIQASYQTDYATVQLTLTLFLVGIAVAQLIYGPLSDRFGRRPIVLAGLAILVVGTIICLLAPNIEALIAGRLVQAVGGCAGMVMGRAMVRDLYDANRAAQMIAYLTMAAVVAPTTAPLVGGILEEQFSWQASFVLILVASVGFLIFAYTSAHETLPSERRRDVRFGQLFQSFWVLLKNPLFNGYACQVGFSTGAYFAFVGGTPYVAINLMGATPAILGGYFLLVTMFYIGGNFGTARLAERFGVSRMVTIGTLISLTGAVAMLAVEMAFGLVPVTFFGIMSILAAGNGFCISAGTAAAISADPERVGAASGLAGSMQIGFSAVSTFVAGLLLQYYVTTPMPLILVMVGFCIMAVISPVIGRRVAHAAATGGVQH